MSDYDPHIARMQFAGRIAATLPGWMVLRGDLPFLFQIHMQNEVMTFAIMFDSQRELAPV
jgi:hypothetical protein